MPFKNHRINNSNNKIPPVKGHPTLESVAEATTESQQPGHLQTDTVTWAVSRSTREDAATEGNVEIIFTNLWQSAILAQCEELHPPW